MFRTVLLPVDFSEENSLILKYARGLPAIGVRQVILGHVVEDSGVEGPVIAAGIDEAREGLREHAEALASAGLVVEVRVASGDPVQELTAIAAETRVDALVYGSHGRSIVSQLFSGSIAERLLRDAQMPHLVVRYDLLRNQADPADLLRHFGEKVVLPTDFSLSASRAFSGLLTMQRGAIKHLFLLHVVDPDLTGEKLRRAEEGAEFQLANLQSVCAQQGISASVSIRTGAAVDAILGEIDERRANGVIVGTRGRNAVQEMLLGSVSMTLLRQASCPVLIVP